ncbi:transcription factor adf-1 [Plakobranchus ocellatus]|uniref:Transcription factor adf-1 n=1 Tax=Plakobranchus ocellatus TaxID=259542 RepID=A0AAV4AB38_9GAST|nr:transcription factor adf-1 [Plakobranchus ocellatus]
MSDQSSTLSQEDIKLIRIGLVRQNPALYDPGHVDYKNRVLKDKTWAEINNDIGIPNFDARKEWTTLRNYANNHHDRLKMSSGSAASLTTSGGKRKKSEWQYAADMQFLLPLLGKHWEMDSTRRKSPLVAKKHLLLRQIVTF